MARHKSDIDWNDYLQKNFGAPTLAWLIERRVVMDIGGILLPSKYYAAYLASERQIPGYEEFDRTARAHRKNVALREAASAMAARLAEIRAAKIGGQAAE